MERTEERTDLQILGSPALDSCKRAGWSGAKGYVCIVEPFLSVGLPRYIPNCSLFEGRVGQNLFQVNVYPVTFLTYKGV